MIKQISSQKLLLVCIGVLAVWVGLVHQTSSRRVTDLPNQILKINSDNILRFEIDAFAGKYVVAREPGQDWALVAPYKAVIEQKFFNVLALVFNPLVVERIVEDEPSAKDLKTYGLDQALLSMDIVTQSDRWTMLVGRLALTGDVYYVKFKHLPQIFLVSLNVVLDIFREAPRLQITKLFPKEMEGVELLRWVNEDHEIFEIEKAEEGWCLKQPFDYALDVDKIQQLLTDLGHLEFRPELFETDVDFSSPHLRIEFKIEGETTLKTIVLAKLEPQHEAYPIRVPTSDKVHLFSQSFVEEFLFDPYPLMSTQVYPFINGDIEHLEVRSLGELRWKAQQNKEFFWELWQDEEVRFFPNHRFYLFLTILENDMAVRHVRREEELFEGEPTLQIKVTLRNQHEYVYTYYHRHQQWFLRLNGDILEMNNNGFEHSLATLDDLKGSDPNAPS